MHYKTYHLVYVGMFSILLAICSWLSIPTMIPFTLQTFGVFFTMLMLGGKLGTSAISVYLLLGIIGIPVFSNFGAGLGYLLGSTGGFAAGFLLIGLVFWLFEKFLPNKPIFRIISLLLGLAGCYSFGCFWFLHISASSTDTFTLSSVFSICVLPFLIPDFVKLGLAYMISKRLKPILNIN